MPPVHSWAHAQGRLAVSVRFGVTLREFRAWADLQGFLSRNTMTSLHTLSWPVTGCGPPQDRGHSAEEAPCPGGRGSATCSQRQGQPALHRLVAGHGFRYCLVVPFCTFFLTGFFFPALHTPAYVSPPLAEASRDVKCSSACSCPFSHRVKSDTWHVTAYFVGYQTQMP